MKITKCAAFLSREKHRNLIFIEVETDGGMSGVGEAYSVGPDETVPVIVEHFESWLVGEDPRDRERLWLKMYNFSRFPGGLPVMSALSGIDMALWDLAGKIAGVPVWHLLGGRCRDRIRTYGHVHGDTPSELADNAKRLVDAYGFTALKCFPTAWRGNPWGDGQSTPPWSTMLKTAGARMTALRKALGDDFDIAVDLHATIFNAARAFEMVRLLEPYRPLFVEEPVRQDNMDALSRLTKHASVPVATGEMLYTPWEFRTLLERKGAHIVQPDVCCAGGLTGMKKIAAVAESFHALLAPHNPMGPVATAANVHLAATVPNFLILEYIPDDTPERTDVVDAPPAFSDGFLEIPDTPGLGISLDRDGVRKHPPQTWHRPFRYFDDGLPAQI